MAEASKTLHRVGWLVRSFGVCNDELWYTRRFGVGVHLDDFRRCRQWAKYTVLMGVLCNVFR